MRSEQYSQGFRAAWKEAITFLHEKAEAMNDPHARQVLNAAAFDLGVIKRKQFKSKMYAGGKFCPTVIVAMDRQDSPAPGGEK